jgi:hypothetical protein
MESSIVGGSEFSVLGSTECCVLGKLVISVGVHDGSIECSTFGTLDGVELDSVEICKVGMIDCSTVGITER